jgi:hypothetical protein
MAKSNKNKKNQVQHSGNRFLKEDIHKKDLAHKHKAHLGMDVPDNYFSKSKETILKSLQIEKEQKQTLFWLKPAIAYPIAASIVILIGIVIWMQKDTKAISPMTNTQMVQASEDATDHFLLSSLLVEEDKLDAFMDDFIVNEILVEAELSEQQLENIFINSLFIEDSLIDSYIDENLIENIVL